MTELERIAATIAADPECPFLESRRRPVPGEGPGYAPIFFVGEAPGKNEDEEGRPLVGNAGRVFERWLGLAGLRREQVFITNLIKCRPPENRAPRAAEVKHCLPYLLQQLAVVKPRVVCPMGSHALRALLGKGAGLTRIHGQPQEREGVIYVPLYHPAAAFYREELKAAAEADFQRLGELIRERRLLDGPMGAIG